MTVTVTVTGTGRVYFKYHASIFTYRLIDQLIDIYIKRQTKQTEGKISVKADIRMY